MSPVRLLILAVLFYIAWRLLKGIGSDSSSSVRRDTKGGGGRVEDVLVEDPVCHTLVPKHQALSMRRKGIIYYFCSEQCREAFKKQDSDNSG